MIRGWILIVLVMIAGSIPAQAQNVMTVDLALDHVDITTGFNGAHIVLYGVREGRGEIAVVIKGPLRKMTVRKKMPVAGAWINRASMTFKNVPAYYDFAYSASESQMGSSEVLAQNGIGLKSLVFKPENQTKAASPEIEEFQKALIRNNQKRGLFPQNAKKVQFLDDHFFKVEFYIPANVPVGEYKVETFYMQNIAIRDRKVNTLRVAQVGNSAAIHEFSLARPLIYSWLCILLAIFAGWFSNRLRQRA